MGIPAATIIYRAGQHLQDVEHVRWTPDELVTWINEAAKAIVARRPDAGASTQAQTLVAGTKQTLSADIHKLLDVTRNMGTGSTPGRVVKRASRMLMDNADPDWHTRDQAAVTRNFMYDEAVDPLVFYVHPPAVADRVLEVIVSRFPADITSATSTVDMDAGWEEAMLNFVLHRCYAKDDEYADPAKAVAFYNAFVAALGADQQQAAQ